MPTNQASYALCPHCATTFSVSPAQLEAALGAVRCGKCKKIFNAKFNLVNPATSSQQATEPVEEAATSFELEPTASQAPVATSDSLVSLPTLEETEIAAASAITAEEEAHFSAIETKLDSWLELDTPTENTKEEPKEELFSFSVPNKNQETASYEEAEALVPEPLYAANPPKTKGLTMPKKKPSRILTLVITLVLALAVGIGGTLWFVNSGKQGNFKVTKIKLKSTASMLQLRVEFTITNITQQALVIPPVEIQLLNKARQPMASHPATPSSLGAPSSVIQPGQSYELNYTVPTPDALGVSSAKVILK